MSNSGESRVSITVSVNLGKHKKICHTGAMSHKVKSHITHHKSQGVMNRLDPIEELYDMYSEEEDTPRIVEIEDNGLDFVLDIEGLADPYMDL